MPERLVNKSAVQSNILITSRTLRPLAGQVRLSDTVHHIAKLYAKGAACHSMAHFVACSLKKTFGTNVIVAFGCFGLQ